MSSDDSQDNPENPTPAGMKDAFSDGQSGGTDQPLFQPDELDIYTNKITMEAYIFHGKEVDYESIDRLEYDDSDYSVAIVHKSGFRQDLGVKIQWLVRPYWKKAAEVNIVQTKDGESVNGCFVPLVHLSDQK